jgi:hypothetical protein
MIVDQLSLIGAKAIHDDVTSRQGGQRAAGGLVICGF